MNTHDSSALVMKDSTARKNSEDMNFRETIRKARLDAVQKSLQDIADELVDFFDDATGLHAQT